MFEDVQLAIVYPQGAITSKKMDIYRDQLAEKMWVDYQQYNSNQGENE
jgi:hypothetical protein